MDRIDPRLAAFLRRCDDATVRLGVKRSTLSTKLFNDGQRLKQIVAGGDIGIGRLAAAEARLSELEGSPNRSARGKSAASAQP